MTHVTELRDQINHARTVILETIEKLGTYSELRQMHALGVLPKAGYAARRQLEMEGVIKADKQRGVYVLAQPGTETTTPDGTDTTREPAQPEPEGDETSAPESQPAAEDGSGTPPPPETEADEEHDDERPVPQSHHARLLSDALEDQRKTMERLKKERCELLKVLADFGIATPDPVAGLSILVDQNKKQGDLIAKSYQIAERAKCITPGAVLSDIVCKLVTVANHAQSAPPSPAAGD